MAKRWTEAEIRFLKDNAGKMSVQALADALSARIDESLAGCDDLILVTGSLYTVADARRALGKAS